MNEWIPCSERLPERVVTPYVCQYSDFVAVWRVGWQPNAHITQAAYKPNGEFIDWVGCAHDRVTHWMPLPDAPVPTNTNSPTPPEQPQAK